MHKHKNYNSWQALIVHHCIALGKKTRITNKNVGQYVLGTKNGYALFKFTEIKHLLLKFTPLIENLFTQHEKHKKKTKLQNEYRTSKTVMKRLRLKPPRAPKNSQRYQEWHEKFGHIKKPWYFKQKYLTTQENKKPIKILFASTTVEYKNIIKSAAQHCSMLAKTERWLCGYITSDVHVIANKKITPKKILQETIIEKTFKVNKEIKEARYFWHERTKKSQRPILAIIPDVHNNDMILRETTPLNIPVIGLINQSTINSQKYNLQIAYPVFGNGDSAHVVNFFCQFLAILIAKSYTKIHYKQTSHYIFNRTKTYFESKKFYKKNTYNNFFVNSKKQIYLKLHNYPLSYLQKFNIQPYKNIKKTRRLKYQNLLNFVRIKKHKKKKKLGIKPYWKNLQLIKHQFFFKHFLKKKIKLKKKQHLQKQKFKLTKIYKTKTIRQLKKTKIWNKAKTKYKKYKNLRLQKHQQLKWQIKKLRRWKRKRHTKLSLLKKIHQIICTYNKNLIIKKKKNKQIKKNFYNLKKKFTKKSPKNYHFLLKKQNQFKLKIHKTCHRIIQKLKTTQTGYKKYINILKTFLPIIKIHKQKRIPKRNKKILSPKHLTFKKIFNPHWRFNKKRRLKKPKLIRKTIGHTSIPEQHVSFLDEVIHDSILEDVNENDTENLNFNTKLHLLTKILNTKTNYKTYLIQNYHELQQKNNKYKRFILYNKRNLQKYPYLTINFITQPMTTQKIFKLGFDHLYFEYTNKKKKPYLFNLHVIQKQKILANNLLWQYIYLNQTYSYKKFWKIKKKFYKPWKLRKLKKKGPIKIHKRIRSYYSYKLHRLIYKTKIYNLIKNLKKSFKTLYLRDLQNTKVDTWAYYKKKRKLTRFVYKLLPDSPTIRKSIFKYSFYAQRLDLLYNHQKAWYIWTAFRKKNLIYLNNKNKIFFQPWKKTKSKYYKFKYYNKKNRHAKKKKK